jgi:D-glycero-alpha-D-manno-heptose-7-phosphate kinase
MIISKTPLRISFFGGGTDFEQYFLKKGGAVLSVTINKYVYVNYRSLPKFFDFRSKIIYSKIEKVKHIRDIEHPLVRECLVESGCHDVHLVYDSDLPARSGLGSSSSFAVGLYHAILSNNNQKLTKKDLADKAIRLERKVLKEPGGYQDQIAVAFGGLNKITFSKNGYELEKINIPKSRLNELNSHLMLFFTGITRYASEIEESKIENIELKMLLLDKIKSYVDEGINVLMTSHNIDRFGELLELTWNIKKDLSPQVTNNHINTLYKRAKDAGAIGGKLLGAGGGGFLLIFAKPNVQNKVKKELGELLQVPFRFEDEGTKIIFSNNNDY